MADFWSGLRTVAEAIAQAVAPAPATPTAAPATAAPVVSAGAKITIGQLSAGLALVKAFPLAEVEALLTGKGTVSDAADVTEDAMAIVAAIDPELIPVEAAVDLGIEAIQWFGPALLSLAEAGTAAPVGIARGRRGNVGES